MAMNPRIRYVVDGEGVLPDIMRRQVDDIVANLERIESSLVNRLSSLDAKDFKSGILNPIRIPIDVSGVKGAVRKARAVDISAGAGSDRYITPKQVRDKVEEDSGITGVALDGDPVIVAGLSGVFTITNYDSFYNYTVTASIGAASVDGDQVTLTIPSGATGQSVLTVRKANRSYTFTVSIGDSAVLRPSIVEPVAGSTSFSIQSPLEGSVFQTIPAGVDNHHSTDWQVALDSSFNNIVSQSMGDTSNLTSWIPSPSLDIGTTYYARVRYHGNNIQESPWSETRTFTTASVPDQPTITSPADNATGIGETPVLTSSAFSSPVVESHSASDWEIRLNSDESLVWSTYANSNNKTSVIVPDGNLVEDTDYKARVRHIGSVLGASDWSQFIDFSTQTEFFNFDPSNAGVPFGGGFYAGFNIIVDGMKYAVIVAPRSSGESNQKFRNTSSLDPSEPTLINDGYYNTYTVFSNSGFSAAAWCRNLNIGGYTDWYMPSKAEMEGIYRFLKPTNSSNSTASTSFGRFNNQYTEPLGYNYTSSDPRYSTNPYNSAFNSHKFYVNTTSTSSYQTDPVEGSTIYRRYVTTTYRYYYYWYSFFDFSSSDDVEYCRFLNGTVTGTSSGTTSYDSSSSSYLGEIEENPNKMPGQPWYFRQTEYTTYYYYYYKVRAVRRHLIGPAV